MSTTVTYKGSTLTTVNNQTRTLKTAGKYMEGDVILTDVTSGGSTINNQNKTVTPTESQQSITADSGYTGLGTVTVDAISSTYVGSGIDRRSSTDLTASGATVTVPAGYYTEQTTKSISSGSVAYDNYTVTTAPNITISNSGLIKATLNSGAYLTPIVTAGYITSSDITSPFAGVNSTGTYQMTTKAAATITPGTTNQTIAAGTYLTGTQTIAGDANLIGSNILSTANIFGVQGTVVVQNVYHGSSAPGSSTGSNGDIYIQS